MKKKILTLALVLMLLTSCLLPCATAFAQENSNTTNLWEENNVFVQDLEALHDIDFEYKIIDAAKHQLIGWRMIEFEYLEHIPETPLAELKSVVLYMPCVYSTGYSPENSVGHEVYICIRNSDFFELLNLSSFGVLQSNLKEIVYANKVNSDGLPVFRAVYYNAYYLCAKDADGGFRNFYVNCNQTLRDYVEPDLESELLPADALEVFVNDIYIQFYDFLGNRDIMNLYGYWCFVAIPQGNIFNEFFQTIGTGTFLSPNVNFFQFNIVLDMDENFQLQKDYGKTNLGAILNLFGKIFKKPTASCFLLYLNGGESTVLISKNGSSDLDNNMGAGGNGIVDGIQSIDWSSGFAKVFAVILALVFGVLAIVVVVKFVRRKR